MSTEILRDRSGNMIGKIMKLGSDLVLFNASGNRLGHYNPSINATFDASLNRVGQGNLLTMLLGR